MKLFFWGLILAKICVALLKNRGKHKISSTYPHDLLIAYYNHTYGKLYTGVVDKITPWHFAKESMDWTITEIYRVTAKEYHVPKNTAPIADQSAMGAVFLLAA